MWKNPNKKHLVPSTFLLPLLLSSFSSPTPLLPSHRNATSVKEENVLKLRQNSAEKERKVGWGEMGGQVGGERGVVGQVRTERSQINAMKRKPKRRKTTQKPA